MASQLRPADETAGVNANPTEILIQIMIELRIANLLLREMSGGLIADDLDQLRADPAMRWINRLDLTDTTPGV